ncbi:putative carboxypeptidase U transcription factor interactor and regulator Znf-B family [Helianthus annuus]|uniref:E3 ubiquitin-protein ligase n=1 Tax=Helianthus annuus TaxID=4232 RepID=A0A251UJ91_HELAN|nr:E3 ubiquitin-protein ligase PRT6 isoform X1 [Helianthus annuus]KAF5802322.1 putative carboxypeptidase U transcription factor interactor and regulator Znf-B family [Helianthus annuus]KAJ0915384.1 putative carboxypeptidase U transcription factor interactor and regulator Znf-B family [Helianthus annuus]
MFRMEIDSPSSSSSSELDAPILSPKDRILKRLALIDVSEESLEHMQPGIIAYVKRNSSRLQEIFNAILPSDYEIQTAIEAEADPGIEDLLHESMVWLQWLMFDGDPVDMLQRLALLNVGQRGVCGSVWASGEMAYRCRTCEIDPTCAICVPCFVNGDHKDHDYSVIKTGSGCCDCGDVTGWKRSGFCSKHKGAEQIQPLQEDIAKTLGPVLDCLLRHWKNSLLFMDNASEPKAVADVLTSAVVGMLLEFCKCSESLLGFVSGRLCYEVDLLDVLVRAERFLSLDAVSKLHKLLLKLLSDPFFKYEFAKAFIKYYPTVVNDVLQESTDATFQNLPLLSTFGVQIFTVPTLTPRLVKEMDLLTMLLECLSKIFSSCSGQDHRLEVSEWEDMYKTTQYVVKHIEYVMSHSTIPKYMTCERRGISRTWMKLLGFLQGMNPEKREIHIHVEEENENIDLPFLLVGSIANINVLLVAGAFSTKEESVSTINVKVVNEQDSFSSLTSLDYEMKAVEGNDARVSVLTSVSWLIFECLRAIEYWLKANNTSGFGGHGVEGDYTNELEVLSLADWPEIEYDVSSQEISVHIPLHRLLSLALQRALKRCYGESESSAYGDFFGHVLGGCHPYGFSAFVMEHPLRIRVFCSQVRAGMWRKNGDAALASYEWYRFVKWSEQGLELDIFLLQCCAALAPADFYIARIVERFGLSDYLSLNMERANEYEPALVQEMLNLIIQILKERRFCGLTTAQCLQRELIYKLSSGNATHSELANSLPRDLSNVDQLQQVLDTVAEYTYPSGTKQGMYQLRLEYWKELDLYHPRWNLQDLQAAEERYLRFCNASAMANQLPKWSKIYPPLNGLAKVATCKTVLQIIRAVLFYALFTDKLMESRAPDGVLVTSLHLLSLALDISQVQIQGGDMDNSIPLLGYAGEEIFTGFNDGHDHQSLLSLLVSLMRKNQKENTYGFVESGGFDLSSLIKDLLQKFAELDSGCLKKLQILAPEVVNLLSHSKPSSDTSNSASMSDSDKRKAKARERQATIMEKMKAQQSKFMENINSTAESGLNDSSDAEERISDVANGSDGHEQVICSLCHDANSKSPVSFLILLQKSSVASLLDKGFPSWEKDVQRSGKEQALNNDDTFNNQSSSSVETLTSSQLMDSVQNAINEFASTSLPHEVNAFPRSSHDNSSQAATSLGDLFEESMYTHILNNDLMKSEDLSAASCSSSSYGSSNESLLLGKYVASLYDEIANNPSPSETRGSHSNTTPSSVTLGMTYDGFGPSDCNGIYVSSCGHAVHQGCLDRYLPSLKERDSRRTDLEGGHIVDPRQGEFLCPACRGLANSILPDLPREETKDIWQSKSQNLFPSDVNNVSLLRRPLSLLQAAADVSRRNEILRAIPVQQKRQKDTNLEYMVPLLRELYFPGNDKVSGSSRVSDSMIMWDTLKYSLVSTEIAARSEKTSSATILSTGALYEELRSSNGFILSLLLKIAQKNRVQSSLDIPLRLWCTQQFAKSICCVDTLNEPRNDAYRVGEYMTSTLGSTDMSIRFPNLQVWAMASYPVLASDAFSTLMWILFCLPVPFMYSEKTFFPLVHICYVVSITQAAITYIGRNESIHDFRHHDSLLSDIFKFVGEHGFLKQYFVCNYINNSCDINESIRRLSFPFLRRCAILWKLMNSSTSSPFSGVLRSSKTFEDRMDHASGTLNETIEIEELEKVFKIPPLDNIVNDELSRSLVKKWLQHIAKDFKVNNPSGVLHLTPVVPVKLMVLPYLYQDLLQRYMKWKCVNCGAAQDKPALCLLCGLLCSPRWKTCCRDDTCQTHAMSCGAGTGVFLLIRETRILLQRSAHQAFWPSPYLDAFGEEDIGMRRGKPLYLNEERYAALSHMVASHGIGRSSKV